MDDRAAGALILGALRAAGLVGARETPRCVPLAGGVSSDIWKVELARGPVCVKRALPRLKVAAPWAAPIERNRYECEWFRVAGAAAPAAVPRVLAHDAAAGLFAMEFLDFPVWKDRLRQGQTDPDFAARVGAVLASIHAATAGRPEIESLFPTDAIFHAIRLEPYLLAAAERHPDLSALLNQLARRTAAIKCCLVHGDVSPKNILVGPRGPVFLDAECAWYGDPAFDLAFCLNHLLLKCLWVPAHKAGFLACFDSLQAGYLENVDWEGKSMLENRAASLLPGLLLARVDGKSPVEYLDEKAAQKVRAAARELLTRQHSSLPRIREAWRKSLT